MSLAAVHGQCPPRHRASVWCPGGVEKLDRRIVISDYYVDQHQEELHSFGDTDSGQIGFQTTDYG